MPKTSFKDSSNNVVSCSVRTIISTIRKLTRFVRLTIKQSLSNKTYLYNTQQLGIIGQLISPNVMSSFPHHENKSQLTPANGRDLSEQWLDTLLKADMLEKGDSHIDRGQRNRNKTTNKVHLRHMPSLCRDSERTMKAKHDPIYR